MVINPQMYACIDLGSNSFHLLIARWHDGGHEIVERFSEKVQLGEGVSEHRRISPAAFQRGLVCLESFALALKRYPINYLWVVGTNALRVAENAAEFIVQAKARGFDIEVVSGLEEAALVYAGVMSALPSDSKTRLVVDIGGGSTELIVGQGLQQLQAHSLPIGCVSWRDRWFNRLSGNEDQLRQRLHEATDAAEQVFAKVAEEVGRFPWSEVYASSGTAKMLSAICVQKYPGSADASLVELSMLSALESDIIYAGLNPEMSLPGLKNSRKELLLPGWAVLMGFMRANKIHSLHFSPAALREGMLHSIIKARDISGSPLHELRAS
jgi:exopolyphosphatase / guanosine-5'-triphosphate,3'-diphosphate pyrophosphatase